MDVLAHDERMRHLQRLAYGAVASDAERAAAVAELEALRRQREAAVEAERAGANPMDPSAAGEASIPASAVAASPGSAPRADETARRFRWAITTGAAALAIGLMAGWQLGTRVETSTPSASDTTITSLEAAQATVPVAETALPALFDRPLIPADVPASMLPEDSNDPADYRLLLTRSDGVAMHLVRTDGGANLCVLVVVPDSASSGSCTRSGRFPEAGLWTELNLKGGVGFLRGTIHPDGSGELTGPGYDPEPTAVVG
jgi:hypothetical protein